MESHLEPRLYDRFVKTFEKFKIDILIVIPLTGFSQ